MELLENLTKGDNQKFKNKMYALRKELLKDGIVLEVDIYGLLNKQNSRKVYFGTLAIIGLMVEEAGFLENQLIGWTGENRVLASYFDQIVRSQGGQRCYWIRSNMQADTISVIVTDISIKLNYA